MKFATALILSLFGAASAFAPSSFPNNNVLRSSSSIRMADAVAATEVAEETATEEAAEPASPFVAPKVTATKPKVPCSGRTPLAGGNTIFLGEMYWDKLTTEWGSAQTGAFIRAAELKHGRSAMVATVGFAFHKLGLTFNNISVHEYLSVTQNVKFADLAAMTPLDAMKSLPVEGLGQMFCAIAAIEIYELTHADGEIKYGERVAPGLQPGGLTGDLNFNPLNIRVDERRQLVELQNGRAAMFAITAWIAADAVAGSVPLPLPW